MRGAGASDAGGILGSSGGAAVGFLKAISLGILQGLTEFLPVSSSGHLVLAQELLPEGISHALAFDV